ncbi:MFS transporter [Rhodoligotrophos defluvii]|uniref:MFS transporter n=1 Tax=Rhodoligotrophos defluvii TaxID=2561934 RepID=UPI0010CA0088|nr:MFS transporter [Rhodoligotrophos defluvii]
METFAGLNRLQWRTLVAAIACVTVFDVTLGLSFPLFSLILEHRGHPASLIGLNASFGPLGVLAAGPVIPHLTARFGSKRVAQVACVLVALTLISFKLTESLWLWFPLRFLLGFLACVLFTVSESWIVRTAEGPYRGRITAIYASILSGGFALGPAMLPFTGFQGWAPFLIGAGIMFVAIIPISFVGIDDRLRPTERPASFFAFFPQAPVLLAAVGAFALLDAAVMALLPLYGLRHGLPVATATLMLTVLIGGNLLLQLPIGWIGDHLPKRLVMLGCSVITAVAALLLPFAMGTALMWPLLVLIGACGFGIYTMAIAILGERYTGPTLVAGAAAFGAMWGLGGMIGPSLGGWAMVLFGPDGLLFIVAIIFMLLSLVMMSQARKSNF